MASIKLKGDTSGEITIQAPSVAGTNTLNLQASSGTLATTAQASVGTKNLIINGDMRIDQRNAGASVTPTNTSLGIDRWQFGLTQASKFTAQQSSDAPIGFSHSMVLTSSSAYSILSNDIFFVRQKIEGFNSAHLEFGTANAKTVTLSFWVKSSLTGNWGGSLQNSAENRSYPFTYTINSANTWEQKTVTIAGDTTGTWIGSTNGVGLSVHFGLGNGSTYSDTAGAWAASQAFAPTSAVSLVGTSGATLYITGIQLEIGDTATPFENRMYSTELAMCQRYCQIIPQTVLHGLSSTQTMFQFSPFVEMRATPSLSYGSSLYFEPYPWAVGGSINSAALNNGHLTNRGGDILVTGTFSHTPAISGIYVLGSGNQIKAIAEL